MNESKQKIASLMTFGGFLLGVSVANFCWGMFFKYTKSYKIIKID